MSYIVQQEVKGNQYYYLVKNVRHEDRWIKAKKYLGSSLPEQQDFTRYEEELDRKLTLKSAGKLPEARQKYEYRQFLTNQEISRMENIRETRHAKLNQQNDIDFLIKFTFNSNAIEGSKNSMRDTRRLLKDEKVPAGKKLRDVYEAVNTEDAYKYIKNYEKDISRRFILGIHEILMHRLMPDAGCFRKNPVKITGSDWFPPQPEDIETEVGRFITFYNFIKKKYHPIEVAGLVHIKFVQLHPFTDGNGRVGRLLMNFVLMKNGYYPIVVDKKHQQEYYTLLEKTHEGRDYLPFIQFIYDRVMDEYD